MKPLIGITADTLVNESQPQRLMKYGQSYSYSRAVIDAGGVPVILPITQNITEAREAIDCMDGILFAGGNDVHPDYYGQEINGAYDIDKKRDEHELRLMDIAHSRRLPILPICRGLQLLNVYRGGSLHQDISTQVVDAINHDGYKHRSTDERLLHEIHLDQKSQFARILGTAAINANSYHHQAIDVLGDGLTAAAWASDEVVEAIEDTRDNDHYVIAVQSHPESIYKTIPRWRRLFKSFIAASKNS